MADWRNEGLMTLDDWLQETRALQYRAYNTVPALLEGEERARYVQLNVLAATDELHEFLAEFGWKPWKKGFGEVLDREHAIEEMVDVLHFIGNLLAVLGVSGSELSDAFYDKIVVNERRQLEGY